MRESKRTLVWEHDDFRVIKVEVPYANTEFVVEEGSSKDAMSKPVWHEVKRYKEMRSNIDIERASLVERFEWHLISQFDMLLRQLPRERREVSGAV